MITASLGGIAAMIPGASVRLEWSDVPIMGVCRDTRDIRKGSLYIPLIGERFDGHQYVKDAIAQGAAASLWQRDHGPCPADVPIIEVDDALAALQELAAAYRKQLSVKVIGITGSNGKTSTKDLLSAALATTYRVHKTQGNLNNHIGLPLTLLELSADTEFAVLEMGMSGRGEIARLSSIAQPDCAIITNIGEAHMLQLGSRAGIAQAKFEITMGLKPGGVLLYDGDEPLLTELVSEWQEKDATELIRFGACESNDYYAEQIAVSIKQTRFTAVCAALQERISIALPLLGRHNAINALAAIAAARKYGVSNDSLQAGLSSMKPTSMRIEAISSRSGATLLNDAYNASPASMRAALDLLSELTVSGRKLAVLGDMLELGSQSEQFHREIGRLLTPDRLDGVYTYGEEAAYIAQECKHAVGPQSVASFLDKSLLIERLAGELQPNDVLLFKGSRGMRLEEVIEALRQI